MYTLVLTHEITKKAGNKATASKPSSRPADVNIDEYIMQGQPAIRSDVAWYRWEFLRRNSKYKADYQEFAKRFGPWLHLRPDWSHEIFQWRWTKAEKRIFRTQISPVLKSLCDKWKVDDLFPPDWRFSRRTGKHAHQRHTYSIPTTVGADSDWDKPTLKRLSEMGFDGSGDVAKRYGHVLLVEFDLTWPIKDLLGFAKRVLPYAQERYADELQGKGLKAHRARRRVLEYDKYLEVWDLKHQGKNIGEMARLAFPYEDPASRIQKTRDCLKAAQRLISAPSLGIR